ncbi:MAG: peroxiredoxin [Xanthomonadaceae bacterium]|nr:peroxiredoxin [Xanthomonadaceae bacterium]
MLKIGEKIPTLSGTVTDGSTFKVAAAKGQWLVLYFYPKDSTPGCTREAQDFRDLHAEFARRNAMVVGVSRDSPKSHANFTAKQNLPFPLIADTDETWCTAFDVIHEKMLYGKVHLGVVRSTFLVDPHGKLAAQWRGVKVPGHAQAVLDTIPAA